MALAIRPYANDRDKHMHDAVRSMLTPRQGHLFEGCLARTRPATGRLFPALHEQVNPANETARHRKLASTTTLHAASLDGVRDFPGEPQGD